LLGAIETKTMKTIVKGGENLAKILVNLAAAKEGGAVGCIELVKATRHRDVGDVSAMHSHCCDNGILHWAPDLGRTACSAQRIRLFSLAPRWSIRATLGGS
jgi:hypothetical protein